MSKLIQMDGVSGFYVGSILGGSKQKQASNTYRYGGSSHLSVSRDMISYLFAMKVFGLVKMKLCLECRSWSAENLHLDSTNTRRWK